MTIKKFYLTKDILADKHNRILSTNQIVYDENGVPCGIRKLDKYCRMKLYTPQKLTSKPKKYSTTQITYYYFTIYYVGEDKVVRGRQVPFADIIWVLNGNELKEGYELDHINNDTLDNRLDNLQLVTHQDNLRKRGYGRNQSNYNWSDERLEEHLVIKTKTKELKEMKRDIKTRLLQMDDEKIQLKSMYKSLEEELETLKKKYKEAYKC